MAHPNVGNDAAGGGFWGGLWGMGGGGAAGDAGARPASTPPAPEFSLAELKRAHTTLVVSSVRVWCGFGVRDVALVPQ